MEFPLKVLRRRRHMPDWHTVATIGEIMPGDRKIVSIAGKSIGVFHLPDGYVAVLNVCPHELAPVCLGNVTGTTLPSRPGEPMCWDREGEILTCPWHGWEFDLKTGKALADRRKLKQFEVRAIDGSIQVYA